jgi:hypothetical protein
LSEEKPIFYLNAPWSTVGSGVYNPPSSLNFTSTSASAPWLPPTYITISQYNELLHMHNELMSEFMARGDKIQRLQAVVRNVAHYLTAKQDVDGLNPVEEALLLECERAIPGSSSGRAGGGLSSWVDGSSPSLGTEEQE